MYDLMKVSAWAIALRGIVAIIFGVAVLVWPSVTAYILTLAFAIFVLAEGGVLVLATLRHRHESELWPLYIILGLLGLTAGIYLLANPRISGLTLMFIIGAYAVARGIVDIMLGVMLRHDIQGEWLLIIGGLISLVFGLFVFAKPASGALAILWLIAIFAIITGLVLLGVAFALDGYKRQQKAVKHRITADK